MLYYFAYGSNLHPLRLQQRVTSATLLGVSCLNGYRLFFHKRSIDGSGKCSISATGNHGDVVHGAIYTLAQTDKAVLDAYEGKGAGYLDRPVVLEYKDRPYSCFTYQAQLAYIDDDLRPYRWYKEMVVLGAKYLGFPKDYQRFIESVSAVDDPDGRRRRKQEPLLRRMRAPI